jgi:tRNA pseudouridine38-40 synthase
VPETRLRLDLAYDGSGFHGWASQTGLRTVQGELEAALGRVLRLDPPPHTVVAGRTDAGVHAAAQTAHVDVPAAAVDADAATSPPAANRPSGARPATLAHLLRGLNAVLAPDIRIHAVSAAPDGFDARFSALQRTYLFRLADAPEGCDPSERARVVWLRRPLDTDAMTEAAAPLLGEHDWAAFCKPREGATTVRELRRLDVVRVGPGRVDVWVAADAFCHNMVRALVGALVGVGVGRRAPAWPAEALAAGTRAGGEAVLPPHGLTLMRVDYPPPDQLGARAQAARHRRDEPLT